MGTESRTELTKTTYGCWTKTLAIPQQLIISVKEARKLLGKDAKGMSDSQIIEYIMLFTSMGNDFLQDLGSTNYNG